MIADASPTRLMHPLLDVSAPAFGYAAESRVILQSRGAVSHVFEVLTDHRAVNVSQKPILHLIEDLEGLSVRSVVPGSSNRLAVITEAGDAYLFSKGSKRPELLALGEDQGETTVRMLGVGSEFEALVSEKHLWVRGESESMVKGLADL